MFHFCLLGIATYCSRTYILCVFFVIFQLFLIFILTEKFVQFIQDPDSLWSYLPFYAIALILEQVVPEFGYRNTPCKIDAYAKDLSGEYPGAQDNSIM